MSKTMIILGNGFSIDFITKYNNYRKEKNKKVAEINLLNLFAEGSNVQNPWNKNKGFLSFSDCPSLWTLGAHPNISNEDTNKIISDIVTCANMFKNITNENEKDNVQQIYLRAYCELISYIKSLFVYYDSLITDEELKDFCESNYFWGWFDYFRKHKSKEITVVTYNYDIWLERIFNILGIEYGSLDSINEKKIKLIKPHGSINYCQKNEVTINSYSNHRYSLNDKYENLITKNDDMLSYRGILIPPAGECINSGDWAGKLRDQVIQEAKTLKKNDTLIICGISYWYVDRYEIDRLLLSVNSEIPLFYINPNPPSDLNSVLMTVFRNYKVFNTSNNIGEIND